MANSLGIISASVSELLPANVVLLDPPEHVFKAMTEGWKLQQASRSLRPDTIKPRLNIIERFHSFTNSYPWQWTPVDVIEFSGHLAAPKTLAVSTVRQYQNAIRLFMEYVSDARYGWPQKCGELFDRTPVQICDEWNTTEHTSEYEGRPERRPLTFDEVQCLFDYCDDRFGTIRKMKRKGSLGAARDAVMLKTVYAYGLRRREACGIDLADFHSNPQVMQYSHYGAVHVRYGKGVKGSPPRRRIVLTVPEMDWIVDVLQQYISEIRPLFGAGKHPGLFLTERAGYLGLAFFGERFKEFARGAGLSEELDLHSLRHSYATHLAEFGYDPLFIQQQLGHSYASTTAIYTHVGNDFKNRQVKAALQRLYDREDPL